MDWISILGAFGAGAVGVKLLDIVWLQKVLQTQEKNQWLRDQRVEIFSSLAEELLTQGVWYGRTEPREAMKICAKASLLIEDNSLVSRIEGFVPGVVDAKSRLDKFINNGTSKIEERIAMRNAEEEKLRNEANLLINELRRILVTK